MPPKAKKGAILIEGIDTTEMNNPKLQQYMMQIYEKLLKEREERSFFQMERDKLRSFWELDRNKLNEVQAQVRNKEYALELAEEKRQKDVHEIDQKVKYLMYEHSLQLAQASLKEKDALVLAEKEFNEQQLELLADAKELKAVIKKQDEVHMQENKDLRLYHAEVKSNMRNDFEIRTDEINHKLDKKITNVKLELDLKHKLELSELEKRKNSHIRILTDDHSIAFNEIRNYFNNITLNNFSLITVLKDTMEDIKGKDAVKDKQLKEALKENKMLLDTLNKKQIEMDELRHQLANYKKESMKISSMKLELTKTKLALDKLNWDYEVLNLRFENNQTEKAKCETEKMLQATELQREVGGRICYLEEKIKAIKGQVERRENVVNEFRKILQSARVMGERGTAVRELNNVLTNYDESRSRRMTHRQSLFI